MHEIALAQSTWEIAIATAHQNRLSTVEAIYMNRSRRSYVCESAFIAAFSQIAQGSIAQNARIVIRVVPKATVTFLEIAAIEGECDCEN